MKYDMWALCLQSYKNQFTKGKIYKVCFALSPKNYISIQMDDEGLDNGWEARYFILFTTEPDPKVIKVLYDSMD